MHIEYTKFLKQVKRKQLLLYILTPLMMIVKIMTYPRVMMK